MNLSRALAGLAFLLTPHGSLARALRGPGREGNTHLMGVPLHEFLSGLVAAGDLQFRQEAKLLTMADDAAGVEEVGLFLSEYSKDRMRAYLKAQVEAKELTRYVAEIVAAGAALGGLYPSAKLAAAEAAAVLDGPAEAVYDTATEGNMVRLGTSRTMVDQTNGSYFHNGIWGYAAGQREYALQCHGLGLAIIDVTDPANTFRVQLIPMGGGGIWRDAVTYESASLGKTFAYVGAQGGQGGGSPNLWVIDLSYLSDDAPDGANSDPIPSSAIKDLGQTGKTHTINAAKGLLFLNHASGQSGRGCHVFDVSADPWNPSFLFSTGASGRDCHDSFVREGIDGRDILFSSDGNGIRERIYDITDVDADWTVNQLPPLLGATTAVPGIYDHESWLSEDNRYLYVMNEFTSGAQEIIVHDVSDLSNPEMITFFSTSLSASQSGTVPHNGEIRGSYFYVAYYGAGLRVFDISNPYLPVEVGKVETDRDPDGDGVYDSFSTQYNGGGWNTYPYLPSGNILVNDIQNGLYVLRADPPYDPPADPAVSAERDGAAVALDWADVPDARGYSVERSLDGTTYEMIAEHLVSSEYLDSGAPGGAPFYIVKAVNGEGVGTSDPVQASEAPPTPPATPAPTPPPECPGDEFKVTVNILTDNYPGETTWTLRNTCTDTELLAGGPYQQTQLYTEETEECFPGGEFEFTINDEWGDGICCGYGQGEYSVVNKKTGVVMMSGGEFLDSETQTSGECDTAPTPPSPTNPPGPAPTNPPTPNPTNPPTPNPTNLPTPNPTNAPTPNPTNAPTPNPTNAPTPNPTNAPTPNPTNAPTPNPTNAPTPNPTNAPTPNPTNAPTPNPTNAPTPNPTNAPTPNPTNQPTPNPTNAATPNPTNAATPNPTNGDTTDAPTYFTCSKYSIAECTAENECQWTGTCRNCGCVPLPRLQ